MKIFNSIIALLLLSLIGVTTPSLGQAVVPGDALVFDPSQAALADAGRLPIYKVPEEVILVPTIEIPEAKASEFAQLHHISFVLNSVDCG